MYRLLGKVAKVSMETVLLPLVIVIWIETWFRVSAPKDGDCGCGCTWQKGQFYE